MAALLNAVMDVSSENKFKRDWWNKDKSWKNKWKHGIPELGERFFGSSTILVWLTDGWHMTQFLFHSCWQLAIVICLTDSINHLVRVLKTIYLPSKTVTDFLVVLNQHWAADLGIQWLDLPVSHMAQSSTFLIFVADMILRAGQVRHCYNAAVRQYRHSHKIRDASQPLPYLQDSDDPAETQELPLWTSQPNQPRQPLRIQPDQNEIILLAGKTAFAKLSLDRLVDPECAVSELQEAQYRNRMQIRPRALTLTAFARLFLADYFIHGIGGARYDQVTDEFIRQFYRLAPPFFSTATATVYLPIPQGPDRSEAMDHVRHARTQWRNLHYNPQRYIEEGTDRLSDTESKNVMKLAAERAKAIRTSDRLRRDGGESDHRRRIFHTIHQLSLIFVFLGYLD